MRGTFERGDPARRRVRRRGHLLRGHPHPGRRPGRVLDPDLPHLPRRDQGRAVHVPGPDRRRAHLLPREVGRPARLLQPGGLGPALVVPASRGRDPLRRQRGRAAGRLPAPGPPGAHGQAGQGDRRLAAGQEHGRRRRRLRGHRLRHDAHRGAGAPPLRPQAGRGRRQHRRAARRRRRGRRPGRHPVDPAPARGGGGPHPAVGQPGHRPGRDRGRRALLRRLPDHPGLRHPRVAVRQAALGAAASPSSARTRSRRWRPCSARPTPARRP